MRNTGEFPFLAVKAIGYFGLIDRLELVRFRFGEPNQLRSWVGSYQTTIVRRSAFKPVGMRNDRLSRDPGDDAHDSRFFAVLSGGPPENNSCRQIQLSPRCQKAAGCDLNFLGYRAAATARPDTCGPRMEHPRTIRRPGPTAESPNPRHAALRAVAAPVREQAEQLQRYTGPAIRH